LYGGLAFHSRWSRLDPGEGEDLWAEFPAARFFVPAYELEGGEGHVSLRAWRRLDGSTDPKSELDMALEDLERLRSRVARVGRLERSDLEFESPVGSVREIVTWPEWRVSIERVLERIQTGDVQKVVLSRAVDVPLPGQIDPIGVVEEISRADPAANVFSFQFAPGAVFFGASPELLGSLRGRDFRTMAVAGSAQRGEDQEADERLGHALQESSKDRLEHGICVRELRDRLDPLTMRLDVQAKPRLHRLAEIQHLRTDLTAKVEEGTHILDLLSVLHPTAAVCGRPRDAAARVLAAEEPLSRGWYAGAMGWFDGAGNGDFVPGLRCAVLAGQMLRLFAGAGIVEGSGAEAEWEETSLKLRTIGRALGLGEVT
jgi:isochorismate synthase